MTYKDKLIDLLKSDDETRDAMYDSFYKCDYDLQERFIRMYCKNKGLLTMYKSELQFNYANISVELDDTRDFDNQDDTIYQKIYEALNNLTK